MDQPQNKEHFRESVSKDVPVPNWNESSNKEHVVYEQFSQYPTICKLFSFEEYLPVIGQPLSEKDSYDIPCDFKYKPRTKQTPSGKRTPNLFDFFIAGLLSDRQLLQLPLADGNTRTLLLHGNVPKSKRRNISDLNDILDQNPNDILTLKERAKMHEIAGNRDQAIQDYERILKINSNNKSIAETLANILDPDIKYLRLMKRWDNVIKLDINDVYTILRKYPNDIPARLERAVIFENAHKPSLALLDYKYVLNIDPENEFAKEGLRRVKRILE